jgi:hypothetical protein
MAGTPAAVAGAADANNHPAPPPAPATPPAPVPVAALEAIASQAAKALGPGAAFVVSAPLESDTPAPRGEELADRVAQLVAGAMGSASRANPQTAPLAQARALAGRGTARLVFAQPVIARGALRVTIDVYPAASNPWDRVRDPSPAPSAHAFASSPIDAEVRSFLAAIPLEHASVHRAKHAEGDVLAAACGDLDGDGGMELALVSRARVAVGHVAGGKFIPSKSVPWSSLAARLPVPLREPIAGASIASDADRARLLVGTTDRGGVALDSSLLLLGSLRGIPVPSSFDACVTPSPETSGFAGDVLGCNPAGPAAPRLVSPWPRYDALASLDVPRPDGTSRLIEVAREPGGKLGLRLGATVQTQTLDDVGAQVTLADLDQDGTPEIVASAAQGDDAIRVFSWDGAADPRLRLTFPAPAGVRALCACPPEAGGVPALVAVVDDEVWIVR